MATKVIKYADSLGCLHDTEVEADISSIWHEMFDQFIQHVGDGAQLVSDDVLHKMVQFLAEDTRRVDSLVTFVDYERQKNG